MSNFTDLQNAISAQDPVLNIANPIIDNWNTTLFLTYNAAFNNQTSGPVAFVGNTSNPSDMLVLQAQTNSNTVLWNGNFVFRDAVVTIGPSGGAQGAALGVFSADPGFRSVATFNGDVTFQNNGIISFGGNQSVGGALASFQGADIVFNGTTKFINNTSQSTSLVAGGAFAHAFYSTMIFNGESFFTGNTDTTETGPAFGGAIATAILDASILFNETATFTDNKITNNTTTNSDLFSSAVGGAIAVASTASVTLFNPKFLNNSAVAPKGLAYGGAIALIHGNVTIRSTNPNKPTLFKDNLVVDSLGTRQEAFSLMSGDLGIGDPFVPGPSTLIFNADAGTLIDVQDGISSDGGGNIIIKQGLGMWQQGSNSSAYKDTTRVEAGMWRLMPGAVYGNITTGSVTVEPTGTLIFSIAPESFPLLQGKNLALNGQATVEGADSVSKKMALGSSLSKAVALSGTQIQSSLGLASEGLVLAQGENFLYDWQLMFVSPTELDVRIRRRSENEYQTLVQSQSQSLSGGFAATQTQLNNFSVQLDQLLSTPTQGAFREGSRIVLAFAENRLPFQYGETPWAVWAQALGGGGRLDQSSSFNGYAGNFSGLSGGVDRTIEKWRLGFGLNGQRSALSWSAYSAQTQADGLAGAFYGAYNNGPWYGHWILGGGRTWVTNTRNPVFGTPAPLVTAYSDSHIHFYNGRVSTGYNFQKGKTTVTPNVAVAYVHSSNGAYTETGAGDLNLSVRSNPKDNLEAQVGFEALYSTRLGPRRIGLRGNVGFGYELMDRVVTLQAAFATFPELPLFSVTSQNVGRLRTFVGTGVDIAVAKSIRLSLDYIGNFRRNAYTNLGTASLKIVF